MKVNRLISDSLLILILLFTSACSAVPIGPPGVPLTLEPSLLAPLALTVILYALGVRSLWKRAGAGHGVSFKDCLRFAGAILALLVALVSPLDALSGSLFSAHMVQHLILMLVAAPLLVLCSLPVALLWALPHRWARALASRLNRMKPLAQVWHGLSSPVTAWLVFTLALWVWHAPVLYEAALKNEAIHAVEHLVLLLAAVLFWWVLFEQTGPNHIRYGIAIPYLFTTTLQSSALGALMTFTSLPWYPYYAPLTPAWGLTPLQDQQLAGLIMWMPGGLVFTLLTIGYFAAWLRALEQRAENTAPPESMNHPPKT